MSVNIQNVLLWLECRHGDTCTYWPSALFITLSYTPAHTSIRRCIKSFTSCTFWVNAARGRVHSQKKIKTDSGFAMYLFKSPQTYKDTNNTVYKLMTEKLQPVLIFEH